MEKPEVEAKDKGLTSLLGEKITVYCQTYIYYGTLVAVNDDCILLTGAWIVYDVGPHNKKEFELKEALPNDWYVMKSKIESFGVFKNGK